MSQTAKPPGLTAQTTVTRTMVSQGTGCCPCPLPHGAPGLSMSPLLDDGTEGEAADGTEGADTVEKGCRVVSGSGPVRSVCRGASEEWVA